MKHLFLLLLCLPALIVKSQWRVAYHDIDSVNDTKSAFFLSASTGYIVTNKWIGFTSDSGHTFQRRYVTIGNVDYNLNSVNLTFGFTPEDVHAFSADTLVVSGDYGYEPTILYSTNGGNSWKVVFHRNIQLNSSTLINSMWKMEFPNNGNVGFGVHNDQVVKTTNRGQTWTALITDPNQLLSDLAFASNSVVAASPHRIYKITPSGSSWQIAPNFNFEIKSIAGYGNYLFANTTSGDNYYSTTLGTTWTVANTSIAQQSFNDIVYVNDSTGYGADLGIYKTKNRGKTWELMESDVRNYINRLFMLNDQTGWATLYGENLLITSNGGGGTYPRALFTVNTNTVCQDDTVRLLNQGASGNSYKWFRNNTLFATTYNAGYKVSTANDEIMLVAINGTRSDTMITVVEASTVKALTLTSVAQRDTVCSGGIAYFEILNSRTDVQYRVSRPCCGNSALLFGNGSTLIFGMPINTGEDSSTTFNITATLNSFCGVQTASAQHRVFVLTSDPPTTAISDTFCKQNTFYIRIPATKIGYQYWADPFFAKVDGTGGPIQVPCRVNVATSSTALTSVLTRYRFSIYVRHKTQFCGGTNAVATVDMIGRMPIPAFDLAGYEWLTGTNLEFRNASQASQTYTWKFTDGPNLPVSTDASPTNINYTTPGYKTIRLIAITKEGCMDSTNRLVEVIGSTGPVGQESVCAGTSPGNTIDSLKGRQYFVNRALYEDESGDRIVAGGYTDMSFPNQFYPRGFEGWYAARFNKDGLLMWRIQQKAVDEGSFNQNTHIIVEHAVGDKFGYTYLFGHSQGRSVVTADGQDRFPLPSVGNFLLKISPAGKIIWAKTFYSSTGVDYTGGTLLMGNNNQLYIITAKRGAYVSNGVNVIDNVPFTGVILQLDTAGLVSRKRTFPITYNNFRRFNIYEVDSYDPVPPASWDPSGKLVVFGYLNPAEMTGNAIDGVTVPFNAATIQSALLFFDTASLQVVSIKPIYRIKNSVQSGFTTESYTVAEDGHYYASYSERLFYPAPYQGSPYDTLKPKSFISAYSSSGDLLWTKQAEGLWPKRMFALNDQLKIAGTNYSLDTWTNGNRVSSVNQSPTYPWVHKLTAITDIGGNSGKGAYGLGTLDIVVATLRPADGELMKIVNLGSEGEDENVIMTKGRGNQLWVSGTVGNIYRNVLNVTDTSSTLRTYKVSIDNSCTISPEFLTLDMIRNQSYCVDSILKINWSSAQINQVNLYYSTNGGTSYSTIATGISAATGFYDFNLLNTGIVGSIQFKITGSQSMDTITVIANAKAIPGITISGNTTVISGQSVSLTSVPVNGGSTPEYQWQDSTLTHTWASIPNQTSATINYLPAATGVKLRCRLTSNLNCITTPMVLSNVLVFTVDVTTAINPLAGGNYGIHLYPNPVNTTFMLDTLKLSDKWEVLDITGMDGKNVLLSYTIRGQSRLSIDVSKLNAGSYIAVLRRKNGRAVYLKFIKV